jgi:hypothetical protein
MTGLQHFCDLVFQNMHAEWQLAVFLSYERNRMKLKYGELDWETNVQRTNWGKQAACRDHVLFNISSELQISCSSLGDKLVACT